LSTDVAFVIQDSNQ